MVITCIDFSNDGHREHLMRSAIKSVLDTGNIAICISNDTRLLQSWVEKHHTDASERLICHSYSPEPLKENRRNGRFRDVLSAVHLWRSYQKILNNIEKQYHLKIDVVVFHYIDLFLASLLPVFLQKMIFTYKWAALYIHPRYLRMYKASGIQHQRSVFRDIDHLLKSNRCVGVGVFDNGIQQALEFRLNKHVTIMPDIADTSTDTQTSELVDTIKKKAAGRIITGSIGMSYYTGTIDLIKLAKAADSKDFFFVFCGAFDEASYKYIPSDADKELLRHFRNNPAPNCLWTEGYIRDNVEYNAVFNSLDIIYMMYPEHYTSSNRLTKAAFFDKEVLAANQFCVGENVLRYELGETATPGNIPQQLEKLKILADKIRSGAASSGKRMAYFEMNNEESFQRQFNCLLNINR